MAGITSGDVITSLDGAAVRDARELARKIGTMAPDTSVKLGIIAAKLDAEDGVISSAPISTPPRRR